MSDFPIQYQKSDREFPFHCEGGECKDQQCHQCALIQSREEEDNCNHENETMHQGDGFVYVTCKDCGADL